jgi:integrase
LRRAEIAALKVADLHQNRGYDSLRVSRKGGRRDALAIHPQTTARLRAYLEASGHGADIDGPLFRPLKHNGKRRDERRGMDPDAIDRVVRKYAAVLGLDRGYSAHSMPATFITTALENGAHLEDVQKAAGHRDPSTTKLYDRRGYNPEKAASFFAMWIFRVILALAGAGMGAGLSGMLTVTLTSGQLAIQAASGFALFVLIYLVNPPQKIKNRASR